MLTYESSVTQTLQLPIQAVIKTDKERSLEIKVALSNVVKLTKLWLELPLHCSISNIIDGQASQGNFVIRDKSLIWTIYDKSESLGTPTIRLTFSPSQQDTPLRFPNHCIFHFGCADWTPSHVKLNGLRIHSKSSATKGVKRYSEDCQIVYRF